ncbi:MAG: hypothetical protein FJ014_00315 [Chloroflexi bacterium]|nr:hypothetical protein [Chloroflexota bacterium]
MSDKTDVLAAIEMLLEEIETVIETFNSEGSAAFASGKHKEAKPMKQPYDPITHVQNLPFHCETDA